MEGSLRRQTGLAVTKTTASAHPTTTTTTAAPIPISSSSASGEPPSKKQKTCVGTVVLYAEGQDSALKKHLSLLQEDGIKADSIQLSDPADLVSEFSTTEEILPTETSLQEVHDGEATIIYYNTSQMLHEACRGGQLVVVRGILSTDRVDINNREEGGFTPVLIAAKHGNKQLFDLLIQNGCDVSLSLDNGNNILHLACFGGNVEIVDYIISNRIVDIESRGYYGQTAVMKAAGTGKKEVFQLLVAKGSNMSAVDDTGDNILHVACLGGSNEIVDYIISNRIVDIESRGYRGGTAVMNAVNKGRKKVFELLVVKGGNLSVVDKQGNNILHQACMGDNVEIVNYLISHDIADKESRGGIGRTPIMDAAEKGREKVFDFLVSINCSLSVVDDQGNNILHVACYGGNLEIVDYLISQNIADKECRGYIGRTPIMCAAEKGRQEVFDFLVSIGCCMSVVDDDGTNILHRAAVGGNVSIVEQILTDQTIDINSRTENNSTPLQYARHYKQDHVARLLMDRGATDV